jgi:general secretion pathway protein M
MRLTERLREWWQRLPSRERGYAWAILGLFALLLLRYGVIGPYRNYTASLEEQIEQQLDRVTKMQRQSERLPQIKQQVTLHNQRLEGIRKNLIPGNTPPVAATNLQKQLQSLASQSGLEVVTTQPLRDEAAGEFRKTTVQMTVRGELRAVANFVAGVEYGEWRLAVNTLEVRGSYNFRMPQAAGKNPLVITLEVGGIMKGTDS